MCLQHTRHPGHPGEKAEIRMGSRQFMWGSLAVHDGYMLFRCHSLGDTLYCGGFQGKSGSDPPARGSHSTAGKAAWPPSPTSPIRQKEKHRVPQANLIKCPRVLRVRTSSHWVGDRSQGRLSPEASVQFLQEGEKRGPS